MPEVTLKGRTRVGMKGMNGFGAGITASRDRLVVRCLGTYEFRPDEVVAFAPDGPAWLSRGFRIVHNRADYPGRMYFSTRGGRARILSALAEAGFVPSGRPFTGRRPLGTYWKVFIVMAIVSAFLIVRQQLTGQG